MVVVRRSLHEFYLFASVKVPPYLEQKVVLREKILCGLQMRVKRQVQTRGKWVHTENRLNGTIVRQTETRLHRLNYTNGQVIRNV